MLKLNKTSLVVLSVSAFVMSATIVGAQNLNPKPTPCSQTIEQCGCTLTQPGATYTVAADLNATDGLTKAGNCLEMTADHDILDLVGHAIIGNGSGIGILIQRSAHDSTVQGTDTSEAGQAVVNHWGTGIEVDASNVVIELFNGIGSVHMFDQTGNTGDGILLRNASSVTVDNFHASFNGGSGVDVQGGSNNRIMNCDSLNNAGNGMVFASSNGNTITNCTITANMGYGIWLNTSDQNQIFTSAVNGNKKTGILVGCQKEGKCLGSKGSNLNHLSSTGANGNSSAGIAVEQGSSNNQITSMTASGNGGGNDLIDNNPNCDGNLWFNNGFGAANQTCIH
jgi:parallel beta-helix repeat protein